MNNKVLIKVSNYNYYKLINKLNNLNVFIYNTNKHNKYVFFEVSKSDYLLIKKYARNYKFKIMKEKGLHSIVNALKKNKSVVFIIFFSVLILVLCNNVIVDVSIIHENKELINIINMELKDHNIKMLSIKKNYHELSLIKNDILEKYKNELEWLEIDTIGMKYVIKFEERIIKIEEEKEEYCDVYAKESGLITSISVKKGVPTVKIGDYVNEGDLLITGQIIYNEDIKNEVCAEGVVMAERWYETSVVVPYEYETFTRTGLMRFNLLFEHENFNKKILNDRINEYESEYVEIFNLFGYKLSLEKQYEIETNIVKYTEKEALNQALFLAEEKMNLKLDEVEEIIEKKVLKNYENNSTIEVDIFIVTREIIN